MKSKIILCLTMFLAFGYNSNAQLAYDWTLYSGTPSGNDGSQNVGVDAAGNSYTVGYFQGTMDADPGASVLTLTTAGAYDIFISKFDPLGALVWSKRIGAAGNDAPFGLVVYPDGSLFITGYINGVVDFDPNAGTTNIGTAAIQSTFVTRIDSSGNLVWAKFFNGNAAAQGYDIKADGFGMLYIGGYFGGTCDFDPNGGVAQMTANTVRTGFVAKLTDNGVYQFAKQIRTLTFSTGVSNVFELALDNGANPSIYVVGNFKGQCDFDPADMVNVNITANGPTDAYTLKLTNSGAYSWVKILGGSSSSSDGTYGVDVDDLGDIYTTGRFAGTVDFDPGASLFEMTSNGGADDIFIQKLNGNGDFINAIAFGSAWNDSGQDVVCSASGDVYLVGHYGATMDADPGVEVNMVPYSGMEDVILQKYDSNLNQELSFNMGGDLWDFISDVDFSNGDIYIAGSFASTLDIDPTSQTETITSLGDRDWFLSKYVECTNLPIIAGLTDSTFCENETVDLQLIATISADNYVWTLPIGWSGTLTSSTDLLPAVVGSQGGVISIQGTNSCGMGEIYTFNVDVLGIPSAPSAITGESNVCEGETAIYSINSVPNATSYTWTYPNDWTVSQNDTAATATILSVSGALSVVASNSCFDSPSTLINITLNPLPTAATSYSGGVFTSQQANATSYQWVDCNTLQNIPGETGQLFTPTSNGSYGVVVYLNGCTDEVECFQINDVSLQELNTNAIRLYPNPNDGRFTIESKEAVNKIEIIDLTGKSIESINVPNLQLLDLETNYGKGVYFIKLYTESSVNSRTIKFTID